MKLNLVFTLHNYKITHFIILFLSEYKTEKMKTKHKISLESKTKKKYILKEIVIITMQFKIVIASSVV